MSKEQNSYSEKCFSNEVIDENCFVVYFWSLVSILLKGGKIHDVCYKNQNETRLL